MDFTKHRLICLNSRRYKNLLQVLLLVISLFEESKLSEAALPQCSANADTTIASPCKFSPGIHLYNSLTIKADVFLATTSSASTHILNVTQTLDIQEKATLTLGYNDKGANNSGAGVERSGYGSGGSYGGRGGAAAGMALTSSQATPYGSAFDAASPGSSGGGSGGGLGGGALKIEARKVIINGRLEANGQRAENDGGGGSGGCIAVNSFEIDGSGELQAVGGLGSGNGGGGSGGRISLHFQQGAFLGRTRAFGGKTGK